MFKYFSKAFKVTNENIILTTPLVLFLFLLSIYLGFAKNAPSNLPSAILLFVTILFMISAFMAGWLYMVRKTIELDKQEFILDEDKAKASFNLIKEIPIGIGEYFFSFIGASILYTTMLVGILFVTFKLGMHFIGDLGLTAMQLKMLITSSETMKSVITHMSKAQLIRLNAWNLTFFAVAVSYSFLTLLWSAQIVMKTKNPLLALFQSISLAFKNFLSTIILYVYITFINFMVSLVNAFGTTNPIIYFISMIIYFYFIVYVVVLIFLYYDRELKDNGEETAPNNSDSGTDSDGQDKPSD